MKTAIVTGASRGIGAATARLLARHGYAVVVNYSQNQKSADKVVSDITEAGGEAIAVKADMAVESDILELFDVTYKKFGNIDVLVNNAAVNPSYEVEASDYAVMENLFRVNVFGVFIACREAIKYMKKNRGGMIVNVSSESARFGGNRMTHYAASKAAINTFSIGLAREVAPFNIRVNVVSPGVIDTDAHAKATPERLAALKSSLPMGRMGKPEEVAETIAWLVSNEASYISGSLLSVAGAR